MKRHATTQRLQCEHFEAVERAVCDWKPEKCAALAAKKGRIVEDC